MSSAERQLRVQDLFLHGEFIDLSDLCRKLGASRSTIRRDLIALEKKEILRRVHGGAISLRMRDEGLDFARLSDSCREEKNRIGKVAASLVQDHQTIILTGGSTTVEVARNLLGRPVQVITSSIPVAQVFWDCKQVEVTMTGGYMYPRLGVQLGPICERMLSGVAAELLIMGVRGISAAGLSDSNTLIVASIRKMIEVSRRVIIVADHTKFGHDSMVHLADLDVVDMFVTDNKVPPEFCDLLAKHNVKCVLAE